MFQRLLTGSPVLSKTVFIPRVAELLNKNYRDICHTGLILWSRLVAESVQMWQSSVDVSPVKTQGSMMRHDSLDAILCAMKRELVACILPKVSASQPCTTEHLTQNKPGPRNLPWVEVTFFLELIMKLKFPFLLRTLINPKGTENTDSLSWAPGPGTLRLYHTHTGLSQS